MSKAIVDVSCELLRQLLYLPEHTQVVMALLPQHPASIRLVLEGPFFEQAPAEGKALPIVSPSFERVESPSTITIIDWGFPLAGDFA